MITKAVEDLFSFIDFLHLQKDYLLRKQNLIDEFNGLLEERNSLKPNSNYRAKFEDAFDEIEILGFPVSYSPFDILQTKYRGSVMAKELTKYHKQDVKMLAYLISRKHVPTKRGTMFFGTWIDAEGEYFDTAHFSDCLEKYPFQGGGCYLLLGTVEVDFHFPTITIKKMAKMPFIPDPRYSLDKEMAQKAQTNMREDISMTFRKPYPQEQEIGLPRYKMS